MKNHNIVYKNEIFAGVIYGSYLTSLGMRELLDIVSKQVVSSYPFFPNISNEKIDLSGNVSAIDESHGRLTLAVKDIFFIQFLVLEIPTDYLTFEDFVTMNNESQNIFPEKGIYGKFGVTDSSTLEYTVGSVKDSIRFGVDSTPTILSKASKCWYRTAYYQAFSNGNKRTGLLAAINFLYLNYLLIVDIDNLDELYKEVSIKIANKEMSENQVRAFLFEHVEYDIERSTKNYIERNSNK